MHAGQRKATQGECTFLILFIEEKKRREKIDSPPLPLPGVGFQAYPGRCRCKGCALRLGLGRPPALKRCGGLAASQGIGVSKKRCQAGRAKQAGPLLWQLRWASWGCWPHPAWLLSAAAHLPAGAGPEEGRVRATFWPLEPCAHRGHHRLLSCLALVPALRASAWPLSERPEAGARAWPAARGRVCARPAAGAGRAAASSVARCMAAAHPLRPRSGGQ